jgi:hypothetical protein
LFLHHFDIDRVCSKEAVHSNWTCLTNTMASILGLAILMRVPIAIKNDACIGASLHSWKIEK